MAVPQLHPSPFERIADSGGSETDLHPDGGKGVTVRIKLLGLFGQLGGQLLARAQADATTAQMAGDGVAVGAELASQLVDVPRR